MATQIYSSYSSARNIVPWAWDTLLLLSEKLLLVMSKIVHFLHLIKVNSSEMRHEECTSDCRLFSLRKNEHSLWYEPMIINHCLHWQLRFLWREVCPSDLLGAFLNYINKLFLGFHFPLWACLSKEINLTKFDVKNSCKCRLRFCYFQFNGHVAPLIYVW